MRKIIVLFIFAVLAMTSVANVKGDKDVVYVMGASMSFKDSVVYFTEIQPIEGVSLIKGSKFLPHRQ